MTYGNWTYGDWPTYAPVDTPLPLIPQRRISNMSIETHKQLVCDKCKLSKDTVRDNLPLGWGRIQWIVMQGGPDEQPMERRIGISNARGEIAIDLCQECNAELRKWWGK